MSNKNSKKSKDFLIFSLDNQQFALPVEYIEIVVRMVEVQAIPGTPPSIYGIINFRGVIIPVVNMRVKFGFESRKITIDDHLIIMQHDSRYTALIVDNVREVTPCDENDITVTSDVNIGESHFTGVLKLSDGIILLNYPENLISPTDIGIMDELRGDGYFEA